MPLSVRLFLPLALLAAGCTAPVTRAVDALPPDALPGTVQLAETKDTLDALDRATAPVAMAVDTVPRLTGRGFAQVAGQPGKTVNERRLMAMRAARMDALRDLTEQVHGIRLNASTTIANAVVQNDSLSAVVNGTL